MASPDTHITAAAFEARVERAAGVVVADRVRALDRWLEQRGAHLDAFMKTTMVSLFPWWSYEVPRTRLPVMWPIAVRIEGPSERVMIRFVFQELRHRPPFDDIAVRRELRDRIVPAGFAADAHLGGRPGVDVGDLDDDHIVALFDALDWFLITAGLA